MTGPASPEILHYVGYDTDRGGLVALIRALIGSCSYRGLLGVNPDFAQHTEPQVETLVFPRTEGERIGLGPLWRARTVAQEVRRWMRARPGRIFHGHSRAGLLVALWLQRWGERKVVVSVHCYGRQRWFYRWAQARFRGRWFWLTPAMKRHYGLPDASWDSCMPNGVGGSWSSDFRRAPRTAGRLRVGGAGALVHWKRWDLVLDALARAPEAPIEFVHIGGEIDSVESRRCAAELRAKAARLGLESRVHWLGWQPDSRGFLEQVDAVVVASDGEPFSMIALEALYAGLPVIATRGGGPEDFVQIGENGWLVRRGDAGALAENFARLLSPAGWQSLRVRPDHLRRFSMNQTLAPRWDEIYAKVAEVGR